MHEERFRSAQRHRPRCKLQPRQGETGNAVELGYGDPMRGEVGGFREPAVACHEDCLDAGCAVFADRRRDRLDASAKQHGGRIGGGRIDGVVDARSRLRVDEGGIIAGNEYLDRDAERLRVGLLQRGEAGHALAGARFGDQPDPERLHVVAPAGTTFCRRPQKGGQQRHDLHDRQEPSQASISGHRQCNPESPTLAAWGAQVRRMICHRQH